MNITGFDKVAKYLAVPLVLVGFVLMLFFGINSELIKSGLLTQVSAGESSEIIKLMLHYGFQLGLCVAVLGFGLAAWSKHIDSRVQPLDAGKLAKELVGSLQGQLQSKDEQIKVLTEAIAALSKTEAPTKDINAALRALEQGDSKEAKAIFAEVLRSKEAEGRKANKEAAAAARHLGALASINTPQEALVAYQKAVQLDPDNASGWNQMGILLWRTGELGQAEEACHKVLALDKTHHDKGEQIMALTILGIVYETRGELDKAEEMYRKSLMISKALGSNKLIALGYDGLGRVYRTCGELDKTEEIHRKALGLNEALGAKEGMVRNYGNLGELYEIRGEPDRAEDMHRKALELNKSLGSKQGIAGDYGHLGNVYETRGDLDTAEEMYRKALDLNEALNSKEGMIVDYGNLGNVYETQGDLDKAEEMYRKALGLNESLGSKEGIARDYATLGLVYAKRYDLDKAEAFWEKSLHLAQAMGHRNAEMVQRWLDDLAELRSTTTQ